MGLSDATLEKALGLHTGKQGAIEGSIEGWIEGRAWPARSEEMLKSSENSSTPAPCRLPDCKENVQVAWLSSTNFLKQF